MKMVPYGQPITQEISVRSGASKLSGRLYHPTDTPRAIVILNGATGVPQSFYTAFARWLATEQNIACVTYDYRDFGLSAAGHPKLSTATMADWAVRDAQAVRDYVATTLPGAPIWIIGHSLGALTLAFQDRMDRVDRVITVASGPVHVSDHPWPYQGAARLFWFAHGPAMTSALGYLPGRATGMGSDLPASVYWQWRRWCTSRSFFADDIGSTLPYPDWTAITCPVKFVAVADDQMVPPSAVWRSMEFYRAAPKRQLTLEPAKYGVPKIGHLGAFRRANAACWADIIA
ncbi:alpha/beta hydrolase family protein [Litoreibacter roseus]|nr:alpha/beta fold hydrolase [Litoreibacter roseus]